MAVEHDTLARFQGIHRGQTAWVVGRGKTDFDYAKLSEADGPVFFINDAVQLEREAKGKPRYFFLLDMAVARAWLDGHLESIAVIPNDSVPGTVHPYNLVVTFTRGVGVLHTDPAEIARQNALHVCWGTVAPLIHFAWFTGCARVKFIGCDGISQPKGHEYDTRLKNMSESNAGGVYDRIRATQERLCQTLKLTYVYVGTPRKLTRPVVRFVSYATPAYEPLMMVLAQSAAGFGLLTHFEAVRERGGWQANTAFKPSFLLALMEEHPAERIVWVDADAEIMAFPELFYRLESNIDVAAHWHKDGKELLSGTLYFGATKGAREICAEWVAQQKQEPATWDQKTLQRVLERQPDRWNRANLPPEYTFIFDTFKARYPGLEPVIEHHQASRTMK